jgi:hypothetical protein
MIAAARRLGKAKADLAKRKTIWQNEIGRSFWLRPMP